MANKQSNLFSFFSKTPKKPTDTKTPTKDVLSPHRSPNSTKKSPIANGKANDKVKSESEFQTGDVVWAKLEGYPWWPSLVCNHPTQNKHYKGGKTPQIHVQFFDNPRSRAWVKAKYVKPFKGSDDKELQRGGQYHCHNSDCYEGAVEADKAMKMSAEERLSSLIVELQPSESEESAEEAISEVMDFDPDIFDDEMDEDEADNSKENHEADSVKAEDSKSPRKTPNMKRQPSRSSKSHKRRRIMLSASGDEESGDEFRPESSDSDDSVSTGVDENDVSETESVSDTESPVKAGKRKRPMSTPKPKLAPSNQPTIAERLMGSVLSGERRHSFKPAVSDKTKCKLASFTAADTSMTDSVDTPADFPHLKLDFLQPENIRDVKGRRKSDDDYDPRTLHVPEAFMKKTTPATVCHS